MYSLLRLLLCVALSATNLSASVYISEILAENDGLVRDGDGDTPDWIEIHNSGDTAVNLVGWHLTDDPALLTKWTFPSVTISSGGYLLVFASGKDRAVAGAELHANFQLQNGGEYLALVQPNGTVAD